MLRQPRLPLRLYSARFPQPKVPNSHRGFAKIYQPATKGRYIAGYASAAVVIGAALGLCVTDKQNLMPRFEDRPNQHVVTETDLSKAEVTRLLTEEAYSLTAKNIAGVERLDGARLAANSPCEDRYTHEIVYPWEDGKPWVALALFDGHCGWQTADFLENNLILAVPRSLGRIPLPANGEAITEQAIHEAIMKSFNDLDNEIVQGAADAAKSNLPLQEKVRKFALAFAGSCALLSLYDPTTGRLHVACTGDSRAILGQLNKDGKWETVALSTDQNADKMDEAARLKAEHPGEDGVVKDGRVFGLAVSRALATDDGSGPLTGRQTFVEDSLVTIA
ncbi:hypothetical protein K4F52_000876 [Lecanicillium sp. MT-2017a]|nr:hypothetical protein K4F52_000876 [Lecanicillium sp. MT-2017a]